MAECLTALRLETVVERSHYDTVPYKRTVAYENSSLVLKMASGIYKDILPHMDILSKICIEWREHPERVWYIVPGNSCKNRAYLICRMVIVIELYKQTACIVALLTHELYHLLSLKRLPVCNYFLK